MEGNLFVLFIGLGFFIGFPPGNFSAIVLESMFYIGLRHSHTKLFGNYFKFSSIAWNIFVKKKSTGRSTGRLSDRSTYMVTADRSASYLIFCLTGSVTGLETPWNFWVAQDIDTPWLMDLFFNGWNKIVDRMLYKLYTVSIRHLRLLTGFQCFIGRIFLKYV